ncbi:tetratricopeptide repeat protein [Desulfobacterales bacterium HSG17]|nr:tetratricopeptide repeat protein [Desulfobacterales bacterium HSG17]
MKARLFKLAVFILVPVASYLLFSGCAPGILNAPDKTLAEVSELKQEHKNGDRYYYFTESQLLTRKGNFEKAIFYLNKAIKKDPDSSFLQEELASLYLRQQNSDKALKILEKIIKEDPENIDSLILYGKLKQTLKDNESAKKAYEKIIKTDPFQKEIYLRLGSIYMDEEKLDNAFRVYEQLVQFFPDSYVGFFFLGKIYAETGDLKQAEKSFLKTLKLEPDLEEPRFELINIYETQGKEKKIISIYKDILEIDSDNIRASMGIGYYYYNIGRLESSEKILSGLGKESINNPEIIRTLIRLYIEQKNYAGAIIIIEGLLKGGPENSDLHYIAGVAFDGIKDEKMMLYHFKKVKPGSRFYQNASVHIAFLYQEQGEIEKGISFLKSVIKKLPDNTDFIMYLGSFYEEIKQFDKAVETLKQGLKIAPDNTKLLYRLGVVYDRWNKKNESIEIMKRIIELEPQHSNALNYLGYTYADLGKNLDEAEQLINEALKYKPDDGYIIDSLAWVFYKKGEYKTALMHLKKAVKLVPDDPIILEHLGDVYLKLGLESNALIYYKKSLSERQPDDKAGIRKKIRKLSGKDF